MAQHHLHGAQIGAAIEQMCCETVAQHVRRQRLAQPGLATVLPERLPKRDPVPSLPPF